MINFNFNTGANQQDDDNNVESMPRRGTEMGKMTRNGTIMDKVSRNGTIA